MSRVDFRARLLQGSLSLLLAGGPAGALGPFEAALAEGDRDYAARAEGAAGGRADPARVDLAIAAYRRAVALAPDSPEARWRLLRSLYFRISYCGASPEERRTLSGHAREIAEEGVERLEARLGHGGAGARLEALRRTAGAASLYYWAAVSWGDWAHERGTLTAARHGAAGKIRDYARTVIALDPGLEEGGGDRVLGRLHAQAPRIPFLTWWVSRETALAHLERALAIVPFNKVNQRFLAEAILQHAPTRGGEARGLLERCAGEPPREAYRVEDAREAALCREDTADGER